MLSSTVRSTARLPALLVVLFGAGCLGSDRSGHLFASRGGGQATVVLHEAPMPRGKADATLATGEPCTGSFATTPNDVKRSDDNRIVEEQTQRGVLILSCRSGRLIKCEFARDPWAGGLGSCKDTRGDEYSFVF